MRKSLAILLLVAVGPGCKERNQPASGDPAPAAEPGSALPPTPESAQPAAAHGPAWIEDDYDRALARAKAEAKPLVIDLWAEWCHTCLSMKHEVFPDPGLAPLLDRFVWLSLDTDAPRNAAALVSFPPAVWPTFYVVAPADEAILARYLGAASVEQFREFLREGERAFTDSLAAGGALAADDPRSLAATGDRAAARGEPAAAAKAYVAALAAAPADWPRRADLLVSRARALYQAEAHGDCVELGLTAAGDTGRAASAADFLYYTTACGAGLDGDPRAAKLRKLAIERLRRLVDDAEAPLSVDDRGDAMRILREQLLADGQDEAARAMALRQRELLDRAAAEAKSAYAASTFNWPRAEVYAFLGEVEALIPDLEASEKALPETYDPPYRLAWVLHRAGRHDEARAAAERALAKVYGPRKARVYQLLAEVHAARGDRGAQQTALEGALEVYRSLPEGQRQPGARARAEAALAEHASAE